MKISKLFLSGYGLLCLLSVSCNHPPETVEVAETDSFTSEYSPENPVAHDKETLHTDTDYKYEFRSGESGGYKYHYDVSGTDDEGNEVTGEVDMDGQYGNGVVHDSADIEVEVSVEWVGKGELSAEDGEGNVYELEVE
jgi:hypothetical protein